MAKLIRPELRFAPRTLRIEANIEEVVSQARCRIYCQQTDPLNRMSWKGMPTKFGETRNGFTYLYGIFGEKDHRNIGVDFYHYFNRDENTSASITWITPAGIARDWNEFIIGYNSEDLKSREEVIKKLKEIIKKVYWSKTFESAEYLS